MVARAVWICSFILLSFSSFAQDTYFPKPDYSDIEKLTTDKSSAFFYDNLFSRYRDNDTTLTLRDYKMLYYGYFFSRTYSPFISNAYTEQIKELLNQNEVTVTDWKNVITLGRRNLEKNPFDLRGLNIVWVAYRETGDSATARCYFDKLKKIVQTVLSTGDGLTPETAFHILNISHEYDIISMLGYEFGGDQNLTPNQTDYLSLKPNDDNVRGLYFDVGQIFKGYDRVHQPAKPTVQLPTSLGLKSN
jgi:hypothetical protein